MFLWEYLEKNIAYSFALFKREFFRFFPNSPKIGARKKAGYVAVIACMQEGNVYIIARMDVSVYSPISSATGILAGLVASLIFKEKIGIFSCIPAVIALIAVII